MNARNGWGLAGACWAILLVLLVVLTGTVPAAAGKGNSPRINYMLHCQGCHLPGGVGHPGIVPAMKDSVGRFLTIDGGRRYLVQVPGVAQSSLDNATLAEVLNWIIPTFDPTHTPRDFVPFTEQEIESYRGTKLRNVSAVRARLLQQLAAH